MDWEIIRICSFGRVASLTFRLIRSFKTKKMQGDDMADEHEKILLSFFWTPVARRNRNYWRREELICGPRFIPTMTDEIHVQISAFFFRFLCAWFDSGDRQITQLYHPVLYNFFKKGFRFFFSVHLKCGYFYFWFRSRMMNDDANWILKREQLSIDQVEIFFSSARRKRNAFG